MRHLYRARLRDRSAVPGMVAPIRTYLPGRSGTTARVEAGSYRGRPGYFRVIGPWDEAARRAEWSPAWGPHFAGIVGRILQSLVLAAGALLAHRNLRLGLLATIAGSFGVHLLDQQVPLTPHLTAWYAAPTLAALTVLAAITAYGFHTSPAGRSMFGGKLLQG